MRVVTKRELLEMLKSGEELLIADYVEDIFLGVPYFVDGVFGAGPLYETESYYRDEYFAKGPNNCWNLDNTSTTDWDLNLDYDSDALFVVFEKDDIKSMIDALNRVYSQYLHLI